MPSFALSVCEYAVNSENTLTALAVLIAAVTTVIGSVTHPAVGNAAVVPTLKLRGRAEFI